MNTLPIVASHTRSLHIYMLCISSKKQYNDRWGGKTHLKTLMPSFFLDMPLLTSIYNYGAAFETSAAEEAGGRLP